MPRFKKANDSPVTPGLKLLQSDIEKLKYISEQYNTSMSRQVQNWIRDEYKRLKKIDKDGFVII